MKNRENTTPALGQGTGWRLRWGMGTVWVYCEAWGRTASLVPPAFVHCAGYSPVVSLSSVLLSCSSSRAANLTPMVTHCR